jgi:hypothetical protein
LVVVSAIVFLIIINIMVAYAFGKGLEQLLIAQAKVKEIEAEILTSQAAQTRVNYQLISPEDE